MVAAQVILNIPFSQAVKISSLLINQGSGEDASRVGVCESGEGDHSC